MAVLRQLYFPKDIQERYGDISSTTARRYMREMGCQGGRYFVTEEMITAWENANWCAVMSRDEARKPKAKRKTHPMPEKMEIPKRK